MDWIDYEIEKPHYTGNYIVRDAFNQIYQAFWNSKNFDELMYVDTQMVHNDGKITHWMPMYDCPGVTQRTRKKEDG